MFAPTFTNAKFGDGSALYWNSYYRFDSYYQNGYSVTKYWSAVLNDYGSGVYNGTVTITYLQLTDCNINIDNTLWFAHGGGDALFYYVGDGELYDDP